MRLTRIWGLVFLVAVTGGAVWAVSVSDEPTTSSPRAPSHRSSADDGAFLHQKGDHPSLPIQSPQAARLGPATTGTLSQPTTQPAEASAHGRESAAGTSGTSDPSPSSRPSDAPGKSGAEWSGRTLYKTAKAWIYAGNRFAAWEAERLAGRVTRDFKARTGKDPGNFVLIVTDTKDRFPVDDETYCRLFARLKAAEGTFADATDSERDAKLPAVRAEIKEVRKSGIALADFSRLTPLPVSAADLINELHLPASVTSSVEFGVLMSTRAASEAAVNRIVGAQLDKNKIGPLGRLFIGMVLLFQTPARLEKVVNVRDVTIFSLLANGHMNGKTEEEMDRVPALINAYMKERIGVTDKSSSNRKSGQNGRDGRLG